MNGILNLISRNIDQRFKIVLCNLGETCNDIREAEMKLLCIIELSGLSIFRIEL